MSGQYQQLSGQSTCIDCDIGSHTPGSINGYVVTVKVTLSRSRPRVNGRQQGLLYSLTHTSAPLYIIDASAATTAREESLAQEQCVEDAVWADTATHRGRLRAAAAAAGVCTPHSVLHTVYYTQCTPHSVAVYKLVQIFTHTDYCVLYSLALSLSARGSTRTVCATCNHTRAQKCDWKGGVLVGCTTDAAGVCNVRIDRFRMWLDLGCGSI
jgi:hypothetical protein